MMAHVAGALVLLLVIWAVATAAVWSDRQTGATNKQVLKLGLRWTVKVAAVLAVILAAVFFTATGLILLVDGRLWWDA